MIGSVTVSQPEAAQQPEKTGRNKDGNPRSYDERLAAFKAEKGVGPSDTVATVDLHLRLTSVGAQVRR